MKPLPGVVALCLILSINALPDNIEDIKQLPQAKELVLEAAESEPEKRLTRQTLPGTVLRESIFEECSTEKGCAGVKIKDGKILQRFGDLNAFNAAAAADLANEFQFRAAEFGNIPLSSFSQSSSFSSSSGSAFGGNAGFGAAGLASGSGAAGSGSALNLGGNPFLNGDVSKYANAQPTTFQTSKFEKTSYTSSNGMDLSKNPFLNGGIGFSAQGGGAQGFSGSKYSGFGSQGSNVNLIQSQQKINELDYQQTQQNIGQAFENGGGVSFDGIGGGLQQTCAGEGYACVPRAQCNNGVVNTNGGGLLQASTKKQYCNIGSEICCRIEVSGIGSQNSGLFSSGSYGSNSVNSFSSQESDSFSAGSSNIGVYRPGATILKPGIPYLPPDNTNSDTNVVSSTIVPRPIISSPRPFVTPKPTYLPPISSTSAPGYLPPVAESSNNRETILKKPNYIDGGLLLDVNRQRTPVPGPAPDIPAGCAAALKCTPIEYCTADGIISNTTVVLTRDQDAYRVPLTDCKDLATGRVGKCCRDPYYTDPWPVNQLGKWVPGVFGGNDGKYDSRGSDSRPPSVTVNQGRITLDVTRQNTPAPTLTVGKYGQGSYTKGGAGSYTKGGKGSYSKVEEGKYTIGGPTLTQEQGQIIKQGQGEIIRQGQGEIIRQGQGAIITQGQGQYEVQGQGQIIKQGEVSQGFGTGIVQGIGTKVTQGQGTIIVPGEEVSTITQGFGNGVIQGQGNLISQEKKTGVTQGFGQGIRQGQGTIISQGGGTEVTQGFGQGIRQGQGTIVSQGGGTEVTQGFGQGIRQGQGTIVSQGSGSRVSQGFGQTVTQGQGTLVSEGGLGVNQGVGQGVIQGQGTIVTTGQGEGVSQGFGQGVIQGQGSYVKQGVGQEITQGILQGIRQNQGAYIKQGVGTGIRQSLIQENEYSESVQRVYLQPYKVGAQCGILKPQRPYGNRNELEVDFAEIPWQAMVLEKTNKSLLCGGVITRPDVVITSAACVDGLEAQNVLIKGGEWKLGIDEEPLPFQIVQVKTILRHPLYIPGTYHYDAAILVLSEDLRFANNIYPICLPSVEDTLDAFYNGAGECMVTGWGKEVLQAHLLGSVMRSLNVSLLNPSECQAKISQDYPHLVEYYDQDSCTCAQPSNPLNNICAVDIGSALACTTGDGHFVLRGIYSWDSGCRQIGNQIGSFYKFDIEWYEWALGLIESVRFAQYAKGAIYTGAKGQIKIEGNGLLVTQDKFNLGQIGQGLLANQNKYNQVNQYVTGEVKQPINSITYTEKIIKTEPKVYTYTTKPEIISYTTKPEIISYTTKPEIITYTTKPKIVTYTTKPEIITYTTKPEIVTFTTKPEIVTFTTKPEYFTYTTKPKVISYTTKPEYFSYTTKPKVVTYTTKPQFITYETSGSVSDPQYAAPGLSYKPSFSDILRHRTHSPTCQCEGKK